MNFKQTNAKEQDVSKEAESIPDDLRLISLAKDVEDQEVSSFTHSKGIDFRLGISAENENILPTFHESSSVFSNSPDKIIPISSQLSLNSNHSLSIEATEGTPAHRTKRVKHFMKQLFSPKTSRKKDEHFLEAPSLGQFSFDASRSRDSIPLFKDENTVDGKYEQRERVRTNSQSASLYDMTIVHSTSSVKKSRFFSFFDARKKSRSQERRRRMDNTTSILGNQFSTDLKTKETNSSKSDILSSVDERLSTKAKSGIDQPHLNHKYDSNEIHQYEDTPKNSVKPNKMGSKASSSNKTPSKRKFHSNSHDLDLFASSSSSSPSLLSDHTMNQGVNSYFDDSLNQVDPRIFIQYPFNLNLERLRDIKIGKEKTIMEEMTGHDIFVDRITRELRNYQATIGIQKPSAAATEKLNTSMVSIKNEETIEVVSGGESALLLSEGNQVENMGSPMRTKYEQDDNGIRVPLDDNSEMIKFQDILEEKRSYFLSFKAFERINDDILTAIRLKLDDVDKDMASLNNGLELMQSTHESLFEQLENVHDRFEQAVTATSQHYAQVHGLEEQMYPLKRHKNGVRELLWVALSWLLATLALFIWVGVLLYNLFKKLLRSLVESKENTLTKSKNEHSSIVESRNRMSVDDKDASTSENDNFIRRSIEKGYSSILRRTSLIPMTKDVSADASSSLSADTPLSIDPAEWRRRLRLLFDDENAKTFGTALKEQMREKRKAAAAAIRQMEDKQRHK